MVSTPICIVSGAFLNIRAIISSFLALGTMAVFPLVAEARPLICAKLERQLASFDTVSFNPGANKYSKAANAQSEQLQIARSQARRAGCGGSFLFLGSDNSNSAQCSKLNNTIQRMERNLAALNSKSGQISAPKPNRGRILAALDANDCNGRIVASSDVKRKLPAAVSDEPVSLFQQLFGSSATEKKLKKQERQVASVQKTDNQDNGQSVTLDSVGPTGLYRTLCVRTCDGYYFPVSFSTVSSHFPADEKACASMCPAAETKLYYHSVPDEEPEQMISLAKEPYASTATAFKYRVDGINGTPGCTCQATEQTDAQALDPLTKKVNWIPLPTAKPSLLDDEETVQNRAGKLDGEAIANLIGAKTSTETLAAQGTIRVVGPVFLPAQSTAKGLLVPGRLNVQ
jgi:Protein of unknown function (DUF2865)